MSETFEAGRLRHVHPGPLRIECGPSLVVVRAVETYPRGTIVTWTCSPSGSEIARLAQGTPHLTVRLADRAGTDYTPLGESVQEEAARSSARRSSARRRRPGRTS